MRLRRLLSVGFAAAIMAVFAPAVLATDPYGKVIQSLEQDYHAHRRNIPLLGLGNFALKFWHPAGVKHVRIAVFDDHSICSLGPDKLDEVISKATDGQWRPVVREFSRASNQSLYVYCAGEGNDTKVMVVTLSRDNAVLAEVKFDPEKLAEFVRSPEMLGHDVAQEMGGEVAQSGSSGRASVAQDRTAARDEDDEDDDDDANDSSDMRNRPGTASPTRADNGASLNASAARSSGSPKPDRGSETGYTADAADPTAAGRENLVRLEAKLINLNVSVTDAWGAPVPGLSRSDFSVFENGERQDIAFFEKNDAPVNLLLLLDLSGSTRHKIKLMRHAAQGFVDSLPASDRIAVAAFTERFYDISDFTTDRKLLKHRIEHIKNRMGGTAFYDAMWSALDRMDRSGDSRKALVVLTDGVDNCLQEPDKFTSRHSFKHLLRRASDGQITIYPVYMDTEAQEAKEFGDDVHEAYSISRSQLLLLADRTGGRLIKTSVDAELETAYRNVAAGLHSLYTLAYEPKSLKNDGKWRRISVGVDRPRASVKAKQGFFDE